MIDRPKAPYFDDEEQALMEAVERGEFQPSEDEKSWIQSGVDALRRAEDNGYAYTGEEMNVEVDQLKERLRNK